MMRSLARFADEEIPTADATADAIRAYFANWADELDQPPRM